MGGLRLGRMQYKVLGRTRTSCFLLSIGREDRYRHFLSPSLSVDRTLCQYGSSKCLQRETLVSRRSTSRTEDERRVSTKTVHIRQIQQNRARPGDRRHRCGHGEPRGADARIAGGSVMSVNNSIERCDATRTCLSSDVAHSTTYSFAPFDVLKPVMKHAIRPL